MKAIKTIQIAMDVREYRFVRDCASSCIELRGDVQEEINKLNLNEEKSYEQIERLDYLHQIIKPTIKFFNDNFDGSEPKLFEYGELKHFMDCLAKVMQNKISKWKHQIQEIIDAPTNESELGYFYEANINYCKDIIKEVEIMMKRLKEIFKEDEDNGVLDELTDTYKYQNLEFENTQVKKLK